MNQSNMTIKKTVPLSFVYYHSDTNEFVPRFYDLEFTIYSVPDDDSDEEALHKAAIGQTVSFQKCMFVLENCLDGALVTDPNGITFVRDLVDDGAEGNFVMLPELTEQFTVGAIQAKLNALCTGSTLVDQVRLVDVRERLCFELFADGGVTEGLLPEHGTWLGNFPFWSVPWWNRNDTLTFDVYAESIEEHEEWLEEDNQARVKLESVAELVEIERHVREKYSTKAQPSSKGPAQIIDIGDINA
jgi:hypothetical protein